MLHPIKVVDIELSKPVTKIAGLEGYRGVKGIIRLHGHPVGYVDLPVVNNEVNSKALIRKIIDNHFSLITIRHLQEALTSTHNNLTDWINALPAKKTATLPFITVAVCTRDRTAAVEL